MLNKVTLIGNLGADPERRTLNDGSHVVNLRVATSETWRDKTTKERKEATEWHRVTLWGEGLHKFMAYAKKGTTVYIEGKLQTRSYDTEAGETKYATEVVVNGRAGEVKILKGGVERDAAQDEAPKPAKGRRSRTPDPAAQQTFSADLDDEIPF